MTIISRYRLELHDSLYFATRELGRLYETEPIIHNYALCYALGLVDSDRYNTRVENEAEYRYFCATQIPLYEAHLTRLNEAGIYVTPARSITYAATLNTWKYANNNYHVEMQKTQKNIPSFGRTKEIAVESEFEFFLISQQQLNLPRWIRLGKWASKAEISKIEDYSNPQRRSGSFTFSYPLNPLDVMFSYRVMSYDTINMPPVSLIRNVSLSGEYYQLPNKQSLKIPANLSYCFS